LIQKLNYKHELTEIHPCLFIVFTNSTSCTKKRYNNFFFKKTCFDWKSNWL